MRANIRKVLRRRQTVLAPKSARNSTVNKTPDEPERPMSWLCPRALHVCARMSAHAVGKAAEIAGDRVYVEIDRRGALYVGSNGAALLAVRRQNDHAVINEFTGNLLIPARDCLFDEEVLAGDLGPQTFLRCVANPEGSYSLAGWTRSIFTPLQSEYFDWRTYLVSVPEPVSKLAEPPRFDYALAALFTLAHKLVPEVGAPIILPSAPKQAARVQFAKGMAVGMIMPMLGDVAALPYPPPWLNDLTPTPTPTRRPR